METKQTNFNTKTTTQKGKVGENIVRSFLEQKGWVIYEPITDGAHAIDKLAIKDKNQMALIEVKTKARRNKYEDTGIDVRHYQEYKHLSEKYNLPLFMFFVDEMLGKVYGNRLSFLEEQIKQDNLIYPLIQNGIIYFPLSRMYEIAIIDAGKVLELRKLNTRSYEYLS